MIITNGSLVLQKVTRDQAGSYTCEASNVEGDEVSKPVGITIMCKYQVLIDQTIDIMGNITVSLLNFSVNKFISILIVLKIVWISLFITSIFK